MDLTAVTLPPAWSAMGWAFAIALLPAAARVAPWQRFAASEPVHVWYGAIFGVVALWSIQATVGEGFTFHLLGVAAFTLLAGAPLALAGTAIAVALNVAVRDGIWANAALAWLTMAAIPVGTTWLVLRLAERALPRGPLSEGRTPPRPNCRARRRSCTRVAPSRKRRARFIYNFWFTNLRSSPWAGRLLPGALHMNKLSTILVAAVFALSGASALAADPPKADAATTKKAEAALKKPNDVTQEAWDKMSDADKKKAVEKSAKATPAKKEKKGGC